MSTITDQNKELDVAIAEIVKREMKKELTCELKTYLLEGEEFKTAKLPEFKHSGDACADVYAVVNEDLYPESYKYIDGECCVAVYPETTVKIHTGVTVDIPENWEIQVRPRSGISLTGNITVLGTVDENYKGEICVIFQNNSPGAYFIRDGDRIAQLAARRVGHVSFVKSDISTRKTDSERGDKGFGSSGV